MLFNTETEGRPAQSEDAGDKFESKRDFGFENFGK